MHFSTSVPLSVAPQYVMLHSFHPVLASGVQIAPQSSAYRAPARTLSNKQARRMPFLRVETLDDVLKARYRLTFNVNRLLAFVHQPTALNPIARTPPI